MTIRCDGLVWGTFIELLADVQPALASSLDASVTIYGDRYTVKVYDDLPLITHTLATARGRCGAW